MFLPQFNTLTTEYSRSNRENLPIQWQLSEKLKTISQLLIAFLECTLNLQYFEHIYIYIYIYIYEPHSSNISEVIDSTDVLT